MLVNVQVKKKKKNPKSKTKRENENHKLKAELLQMNKAMFIRPPLMNRTNWNLEYRMSPRSWGLSLGTVSYVSLLRRRQREELYKKRITNQMKTP